MKKSLNLLVCLILTSIVFSQKHLDKPYVHWNMQQPVISLLDLRTGELKFTTALKENPNNIPYFNEEKNVVYAMTKHFAYEINATNGEIVNEYQYTDILEKKATDPIDPNMMLIPVYFDVNGVGMFYDMNEDVQNQMKGNGSKVTIKRFDVATKTTSDFTVLDHSVHSNLVGYKGSAYLDRVYSKGENKLVVDVSSVDKYSIEKTLTIPIDLEGNDLGLTLDQVNRANLMFSYVSGIGSNENVVSLLLYEEYNLTTNSMNMYTYSYDLAGKKRIKLAKYDASDYSQNAEFEFDCKEDYEYILNVPEKSPMPKAPEVYTPTKYTKKARAEAEQINAERQNEYKKELKKWSAEQSDNSGYSVDLFKVVDGNNQLVKTFNGTMGISIYEDKYVFYSDDMEFVLFDITTDQVVWSILK